MPRAKLKKVETQASISCITDRKTDANIHEIQCSDCGRFFYADQKTMRSLQRAVVHDLDAPFVCYTCEHRERRVPFE